MRVATREQTRALGRRVRGFTLLEVLVSMTVLVLLVAVTAQIVSSAASVTGDSRRHMDADTQARLIFDRMALDFAGMVRRGDVDYYFKKNSGDDELAFYTEAVGYFPAGVTSPDVKSPISVVGYRMGDEGLERLGKGLVWNGAAVAGNATMVYLPETITGTWPGVGGTGGDPDFQVIGGQVFRFEYSFLLRDETGTFLSDQPWLPANSAADGLKDVAAIVVTIAVLDDTSREILEPGDLDTAAGKFGDATGSTISEAPAGDWEAKIGPGDLGLPTLAAAQVRVYQRYFYLN